MVQLSIIPFANTKKGAEIWELYAFQHFRKTLLKYGFVFHLYQFVYILVYFHVFLGGGKAEVWNFFEKMF